MADNANAQQLAISRWGQLKTERTSWMSHWQEITTYVLPRSGRYFRQDRDKGDRRNKNIYDNTGIRALRTLAAGLMGGATSPARPWFRLGTPDPDLNAFQPVKLWLDDVAKRMHQIFQKSNTYRSLHQMYGELGAFGTGASIILPDFQNVIHHYPLTIGEYAIATDAQSKVCTLYREFEMPVSSMVKEFGYKNCSSTVRTLFDGGKGLDQWIPVIHAIEPRADRDRNPRSKRPQDMAWKSMHFELSGDSQLLLRESGFKEFPGVAPRWDVTGGDIYGNSPGMEALGDIKQLQHEQLRKANGIDYMTNPPLQVPTSMKGQDVNRLPGGVSYLDTTGAAGGVIKSAFDVNINLEHLLADIRDVRDRIDAAFYVDMFIMLDNNTSPNMTATEVAERHEEKMLMIGPALERLSNELLYPLIETTFSHMLEAGMIPPPPPDMQGQSLSVELIGILAQAQRAIATNSIDRFVQSMGVIATTKPEVLDNFDPDQWAEVYSDMLGVDPKLIVASDQVALIRQARAKAQAAQAQAAAAATQSQTAKNLAQAPTQGGASNGLQDMMNQFSGYGSPSGVGA